MSGELEIEEIYLFIRGKIMNFRLILLTFELNVLFSITLKYAKLCSRSCSIFFILKR